MSESHERKPKYSAAQAAALILFVVAMVNLFYGAYFGGGPALITVGVMGFVMAVFLWRFKPKE